MRGGAGAVPRCATESDTCLCFTLSPSAPGLGGGGFFCRGAYGRGPSSRTQSLRSIRDVFRLRDDEDVGELVRDFVDVAGVDGAIGKYALDVGERGASSKLGADFDAFELLGLVDAMASKALILDLTPIETSSDIMQSSTTVDIRQCRGGWVVVGCADDWEQACAVVESWERVRRLINLLSCP